VERRRQRTEAIVRDILRHRRAWECPTSTFIAEPWSESIVLEEMEGELAFDAAAPRARGRGGLLVHWLLANGGLSVVFLGALMMAGLVGAFIHAVR
jgi:hypothetical protein